MFSRIGMVGILLPHCQQPIAMSSPSPPRFELVTAGKQHWGGWDLKEERKKGKAEKQTVKTRREGHSQEGGPLGIYGLRSVEWAITITITAAKGMRFIETDTE